MGAALTAGIGFLGGERQNALSRREAARNRAFQAAEAATNRGFQERMRSTEWQAAVADMSAAGINPAVAYSRGGASSPSGSAGSGAQAEVGDSVSSAMQALALRKNLQLLDAQVAKTKEETRSARSQARQASIAADFDTARYLYHFTPEGTVKEPLRNLLDAEVQSAMGNSARSVHEAQLAKLSIPERESIARVFESVGGAGKGLQMLLPIILQMMRGTR